MKNKGLLILAKNVDGGTGTFIESLSNLSPKPTILSIETPQYRKINNIISRRKPSSEQFRFGLFSLLRIILDYHWIRRRIKTQSPNTVISTGNYCNILAHYATRNTNTKLIPTIHNNIQSTIKNKSSKPTQTLLPLLMHKVYRHNHNTVCVSKGVANNLKKIARLDFQPITIYNGITQKKTSYKTSSQPIILNVSRFDDQKDHITLIQAFQIVQKDIPLSKLWLIGDGPTKQSIKKHVKNKNIKNVTFFNWQNDTKKYYTQTSTFVHSSHRDGLPYALLESLSYGVPTISSDSNYGPREILGKNKYGLLVPINDPQKLATSIIKFLDNQNSRIEFSKLAKKRSKYFSEKKMINSYKKLIK